MLRLSPNPDRLPSPAPLDPATLERGSSLGRDAWRRLRKNQLAVVSGLFLLALLVACTALPGLLGLSYSAADAEQFIPPGAGHWFGTDLLGRDVFARVMFGCRISLAVALAATVVSITIGVSWGAIAGYAGGKLDTAMMRIVDIVYSLPFTLFVILLLVFTDSLAKRFQLGPTWNLLVLFVAIGAVEWLTMARIVRGQVQSLKRMEFVEAARTLGLGHGRIIFRHLLPNLLGTVIVYTTLTIPGVMLLEAFLSFLGLGVKPPMSSLGTLIYDGQLEIETHLWLLLCPGAVFSLTLLALNFLGDGLRDALDVKASAD
ncbi:MAG TPA: ABC transporter permease [Opitutaceae bacterium]|nr:ABC transporter permease [Opitutaceae bacterium]